MRHRRECQVFARAVEGGVEITEQIFVAELRQHVRTHQREHRLRMHVGEQQKRSVTLAAASQLVQGVKACRIDGRNIAHSADQDLGLIRDLTQCVLELFGSAKKEWSADLEHLHSRRYVAPSHGGRIRLIVLIWSSRELARHYADV